LNFKQQTTKPNEQEFYRHYSSNLTYYKLEILNICRLRIELPFLAYWACSGISGLGFKIINNLTYNRIASLKAKNEYSRCCWSMFKVSSWFWIL